MKKKKVNYLLLEDSIAGIKRLMNSAELSPKWSMMGAFCDMQLYSIK